MTPTKYSKYLTPALQAAMNARIARHCTRDRVNPDPDAPTRVNKLLNRIQAERRAGSPNHRLNNCDHANGVCMLVQKTGKR